MAVKLNLYPCMTCSHEYDWWGSYIQNYGISIQPALSISSGLVFLHDKPAGSQSTWNFQYMGKWEKRKLRKYIIFVSIVCQHFLAIVQVSYMKTKTTLVQYFHIKESQHMTTQITIQITLTSEGTFHGTNINLFQQAMSEFFQSKTTSVIPFDRTDHLWWSISWFPNNLVVVTWEI